MATRLGNIFGSDGLAPLEVRACWNWPGKNDVLQLDEDT